MSSGSLSLAQIAALMDVVNVRCTKCDRRGRYRIATLIERYGAASARHLAPPVPIPPAGYFSAYGARERQA
jgi:hypothetical protein